MPEIPDYVMCRYKVTSVACQTGSRPAVCRRAETLFQPIPEPLPRQPRGLRRGSVDLGEFVAPVPRPAGVDDRPAVGEVALGLALRLDAWIERGAPGIVDDVDGGGGIGTRQHRPDQLLQVGYVDVVIGYDDVATRIGAGMAHGRD